MGNFPVKTEVWTTGRRADANGERPSADRRAAQHARLRPRPAFAPSLWRADEPATLLLVEALDDGDPRKTVPKRDRVSMLKAPFTGEPQPFIETEMRFGGVQWLSPKVAMLSDFSSQKTRARTWVIDPSLPERRHAAAALGLQHRGPHRRAGQSALPVRPRQRSPAADHQSGRHATSTSRVPARRRTRTATGPISIAWTSRRARPSGSGSPRRRTTRASSRSLDPSATKAIVQRQSPTERPDYYVARHRVEGARRV